MMKKIKTTMYILIELCLTFILHWMGEYLYEYHFDHGLIDGFKHYINDDDVYIMTAFLFTTLYTFVSVWKKIYPPRVKKEESK